tara:strand:- start:246 stop:1238 length:993 start_codon:yes stop_codon:yes gene_type:complete
VLGQIVGDLSEHIRSNDQHPGLIVGLDSPDDAAVMNMGEDKALVFTTDFFAPVVDDPYTYGVVAAANALSDIYAMGALPQLAINLVAWPEQMEASIIRNVLMGGLDKVTESGAVLAGGHTVKDTEPKFGLAVTGIVHPDRVWRNSGSRIDDLIVLTKPLGSGVITTALKESKVEDIHLKRCIEIMSKLNYGAMRGACDIHPHIHACTDVTGYGIIGHSHEMAIGAGCSIEIHTDALPWMEGSLEYAKAGLFSGGVAANRRYYEEYVVYGTDMSDWRINMLFDPQTSGGLLFSVRADFADDLLNAIEKHSGDKSWIIGRVVAGEAGRVVLA